MRTQTVHDVESKDAIVMNASSTLPRYIQFSTDTSKKDSDGEGSDENRKNRVGMFAVSS